MGLFLLLGAFQVQANTLEINGDNGRALVGAMLSAKVPSQRTQKANLYTYSVKNMVCKISNHGGPGDYGITYVVGCEEGGQKESFGQGKTFTDAIEIMNLVEASAAQHNDESFSDCGLGTCYFAAKEIRCTVDTSLEATKGCNCTAKSL
jgi:hypothetical protein